MEEEGGSISLHRPLGLLPPFIEHAKLRSASLKSYEYLIPIKMILLPMFS